MAILDKKVFQAQVEEKLNAYVPAVMVRRIATDIAETLTEYEMEHTAVGFKDDENDIESKQLLELFLDAKRIEGKSNSTITLYRYQIKRLLEAVNVPFKRMTVYHIRQYMMAEKDRGVSMNTIKHYGWIFNSFFGWLWKEGLIPSCPTSNLGHIKAKAQEELPFTSEEIQLIKEACINDYQLAIINFLLTTGCRVSEMCSVNITDVDFRNMRLEVTGKGDKTRTVYFDGVTALILKRYLLKRKDLDPALFLTRLGTRLSPAGVRGILNNIGKRSGVENVHPHRFRHTLATNLIDHGMNIQEVSTILGHANLQTTMVYVHVNERNTENNYRKYMTM